MVSTSENCIHLIDALSGEEKKKINCRSLGVGEMKYTHHDHCLLVSSDQRSADIRYLSLHDNKYLRLFQGHQGFISSISMCPVDDNFLSASVDKTIVKWDVSSPNEVARIKLPPTVGTPKVSYDSSGLVFGVMTPTMSYGRVNGNSIRLFDSRQIDGGPFQVISPHEQLFSTAIEEKFGDLELEMKQRALKSNWTSFQFTSDGSNILVNTDSEYVWMLDGFRPDVAPKVIGPRKNESNISLGGCVTTDCKHVLLANGENEIQVYDSGSTDLVTSLSGHLAPINKIMCNPRYDMFVSGCVNTALWIPKL